MTTDRLHIGIDGEKIVVSRYVLRMRTGRARRHTDGSVTELTPVAPSGRTREDRVRTAARIALPLLVLTAILDAFGLPWWLPALGTLLVTVGVARAQSRAARVGIIAVPPGDDVHVLVAAEERQAYERALIVGRRIRRTWPHLGDLVDPAEADRSLTRALHDLAALMARRQQIRRLRAELAAVRSGDLAPDSPAVRSLTAQRDRVEALWRATGRAANLMLTSINTAALAGESLLREQRVQCTARAAEVAISRLSASTTVSSPDAGPELAERTEAVIAAYRELATDA